MTEELSTLERWRLILGNAAATSLGGLGADAAAMDAALAWLYDREPDQARRGVRGGSGRGADLSPSCLDVPRWLDEVQRLFPKETIERIERDAVERYEILELVTNVEVLERIEPNAALLEAVLKTKHLMNEDVLAAARKIVKAVVEQLMEALAREIRSATRGAIDRRRRSLLKNSKNFDFRRTLKKNLGNYRPDERKLYLDQTFFFSRVRRHTERWQVILLVDQSGSMVSSVIHSAVTAACLWSLPGLRTHLVAFDPSVVDLTEDVTDPVELLMKVQLGGGTDIGKAVRYAADLVDSPRRAILVVISDLYEGGDPNQLVRSVKALTEQGTQVLALGALDADATGAYDVAMAERLAQVGAHVGAMTPGHLAAFVAEAMGR